MSKRFSRERLKQLTQEQLVELFEQTQKLGPLVTFPWHEQQEKALEAATNTVVVIGGNQSGKTTVGRGIVSRVVRREGPVYDRLRKPNRPLKIWVSPLTLEKFQSNWEKQLIEEVFNHLGQRNVDWKYVSSPQPKFSWVDEYTTWERPNELWGKSTDQGYMSFESDKVDLIIFDEEPEDRRCYTSSKARLSTTNGIIAFTFTPLRGLSWTYNEFYIPVVNPKGKNKDRYKVGGRHWKHGNNITVVQMGMADNPEAVAGGGVARIRNDPSMTEAEKSTRLYGFYGYTEGLIWEDVAGINVRDFGDRPHLINKLPENRQFSWLLTADPNKRHGALLACVDPEGNLYITDEHYAVGVPDRLHAAAYKTMIARWGQKVEDVEIWSDPGGAGAQAIVNLADHGIIAAAVRKDAGSVKASIELVRRALWIDPSHTHPITGEKGAPHLYFLTSLASKWKQDGAEFSESRLFWELRQYRQKDNSPPDTPIKKNDDLVDPLRYLFLARSILPEEEEPDVEKDEMDKLDSISRAAERDYLDMVERYKKGKRQQPIDSQLGYV